MFDMSEQEKEEFNSTRYLTEDGRDGLLVSAVKHAIVDACAFLVEGPTKVMARAAIHVNLGQDVVPLEIEGPPVARREMVLFRGGERISYWAEYKEWSAQIEVAFLPSVVSVEQIKRLLDIAGLSIGVGYRRPARGGHSGTFGVEQLGEPIFERFAVIKEEKRRIEKVFFRLIGKGPLLSRGLRRACLCQRGSVLVEAD
jgi:hypothetical protein